MTVYGLTYGVVPPLRYVSMSIAVTVAPGLVHWSGIASRRSVTIHLTEVLAWRLEASLTVTVMPVVTAFVAGAVPVIMPVEELMLSQLGNPVAEQVDGAVPLLTNDAALRLAAVLT